MGSFFISSVTLSCYKATAMSKKRGHTALKLYTYVNLATNITQHQSYV